MALMRAPGNIRLFIALWPTDEVRQAIARWQAQWVWPDHAAIVKPERLHVTLHFLGDVAPERVLDLKYVLGRVVSQGFTLQFGHADTWQHGIAVLRPDKSPTALRALHARVGLALAEIGLPTEERSYRPHVTLARRAGGAKPPPEPARIEWESSGGFVLVQTLGGGRGYQVLEKFGA
jgi:2'-5' RNA ligase